LIILAYSSHKSFTNVVQSPNQFAADQNKNLVCEKCSRSTVIKSECLNVLEVAEATNRCFERVKSLIVP